MTSRVSQILAALAPAFNSLLGIRDDHFGVTRRSGPGAGARRAIARLQQHRAQWDRVEMRPVVSRQVARAQARQAEKIARHRRKMQALKSKRMGGSAVIR